MKKWPMSSVRMTFLSTILHGITFLKTVIVYTRELAYMQEMISVGIRQGGEARCVIFLLELLVTCNQAVFLAGLKAGKHLLP
jgi:hypothetical protein